MIPAVSVHSQYSEVLYWIILFYISKGEVLIAGKNKIRFENT
jgi:hypothetical protein